MAVQTKEKTAVREKLGDIMTDISWAKISKRYFDRSPSWMYHKMDGIGNNGEPGGFTADELEQFKTALYDLSERIKQAADAV